MNNKGLSEFSDSYYQHANVYKLFSNAEDKEEIIWNFLAPVFKNKSVLDLGCGNGRYLELLQQITSYCVGVDQSYQQLQQCQNKLPFIVSDGAHLPFQNHVFDYVFSSWVWGTVLDEQKRDLIFKEAQRVMKPNGSIILIENDINSEFEYYRGRHLNDKTQDYNNWLLSRGFTILKKLKIKITFDTLETAQHVFQQIWKDRLFEKPKSNHIINEIIVFQYKIN